MNSKIYLDSNATTQCDEIVLNTMLPYFNEKYGNPSSTYSFSRDVKEEIEKVRINIARFINCDVNEVVFTSCASESNTTAIMSAIKRYPLKKHIITTCVEHASILETTKYLEKNGYEVTYLSVDSKGRIDIKELENSIREDTCCCNYYDGK